MVSNCVKLGWLFDMEKTSAEAIIEVSANASRHQRELRVRGNQVTITLFFRLNGMVKSLVIKVGRTGWWWCQGAKVS